MARPGTVGVIIGLFVFAASLCVAGQMIKGDWDFCSSATPCGVGEGDCDTDSDCVAGLHCEKDVGPEYNFAKGVDVCLGTPTSSNNQNNQSSGTNTNDNSEIFGGGVAPGTDTGSTTTTTSTNTSGACSNVFYAATHAAQCYGVSQNTTSTSSSGTRTTGQGCGVKWNPGDFNYCRNCGPCDEGVGGCDPGLNHQCKGDLICGSEGICVRP